MWKKFQDEIVYHRTFTEKAPNCFWLLVKDMKIPHIFYKIQNFQGAPWASIITTCLIKLLRTGPLYIFLSRQQYRRTEGQKDSMISGQQDIKTGVLEERTKLNLFICTKSHIWQIFHAKFCFNGPVQEIFVDSPHCQG